MREFKYTLTIVLVSLFALGAMQAHAQTDLKIGAVNLAKLREQAPQAERASRELEREFATRQRELLDEQQAVQQLEQRLAREGDTITDADELQRLERELRSRQRELQRNAQQWEEDVNIRRNEELSRLQRMIFSEIEAFAREQGYDLVLVEGVIHASGRIDITDSVLERLQARDAAGDDS